MSTYRYLALLGILGLSSLFSNISSAADFANITLVNHVNQALTFIINRNAEVLSDFPTQFVIDTSKQASSQVKELQKEAYLIVQDGKNHSGFFGVELTNGKTHFHGYRSKGIAYSFKNETVTFCTPEEYKQKKSC